MAMQNGQVAACEAPDASERPQDVESMDSQASESLGQDQIPECLRSAAESRSDRNVDLQNVPH